MRILKGIIILISFGLFIIVGGLLHFVFTLMRNKTSWGPLNNLTRLLINWFRFLLGIKIELAGHREYLKEKGNYIITRHIGYIDGIVLGSLVPATFVSKRDISRWPLIGLVVRISGTIFVDRLHKIKVLACLRKIEERLKNHINILIFPEGTSTDGTIILPFQTTFFGVPITSQASIVPVIIEYRHIDGKPIVPENRDQICWYGGMKFTSHLWNLLKFKRIDVKVTIKDKIRTETYSNNSFDRKKLSQECRELIRQSADQNITAFAGGAQNICRVPGQANKPN